MEGVALDLLPSLVTTISFYHRAADMIHEPEDWMWCWCAGQMKSPQSTNIGFCALQVTVAKEPFHTAELEIGLTVAKSTQSTPPQPLSLETALHSTHIILHTCSINTYTHSFFAPLSFSLSIFLPSLHNYLWWLALSPSTHPFSKYLSFPCSFSFSFIKMDFLKPPFVLLTAPLSIGLEKGMQFQSFKWLSGRHG